MLTRSDFPDWPTAILYITVLSFFIVLVDLLVEISLNPSSTSFLDRLLFRFGLMFTVSFFVLILAFRMFERQLFGVPQKHNESEL